MDYNSVQLRKAIRSIFTVSFLFLVVLALFGSVSMFFVFDFLGVLSVLYACAGLFVLLLLTVVVLYLSVLYPNQSVIFVLLVFLSKMVFVLGVLFLMKRFALVNVHVFGTCLIVGMLVLSFVEALFLAKAKLKFGSSS